MKRLSFGMLLLAALLLGGQAVVAQEAAAPAAAPAPAPAAQEEMAAPAPAAVAIERMVVCESIVDREPSGVAETFPASVGTVYCFVEAKEIAEDTPVSFVWYFQGNQMAKVDLTLRQGSRWRTYSSKNLGGLKGSWKVELHDQSGVILKIAEFAVE